MNGKRYYNSTTDCGTHGAKSPAYEDGDSFTYTVCLACKIAELQAMHDAGGEEDYEWIQPGEPGYVERDRGALRSGADASVAKWFSEHIAESITQRSFFT